jgi:hypothetical protein
MYKKMMIAILFCLLIASCSSSVTAKRDSATYLESVDENGMFDYIKLVDKETGCKYLVVEATGTSRASVIQMLGKNGLPLCK